MHEQLDLLEALVQPAEVVVQRAVIDVVLSLQEILAVGRLQDDEGRLKGLVSARAARIGQ